MRHATVPLSNSPSVTTNFNVTQISLVNYRSYQSLRLGVDATPVVLTGDNGSGKTNLLEAISLLVPGRGLRKAALADLQNQYFTAPWAVAAKLETPSGELAIGTGRDPQNLQDSYHRIVHIDGQPVRGLNSLANHVAMAWITPDMDRILGEGATARRKLLDRLTYSFDPAHGGRITRYEKAARERLHLLREGRYDRAWLDALEGEMTQTGVALAATRRHMIDQLQLAIVETNSAFPQALVAAHGFAEDLLANQPALMVEDALRSALAASRAEDAQAGITHIGPHRSDMGVVHVQKNCRADLCSTGEQKALIIAIMLAYLRILVRHRQMTPIFLLDDIAAHLDEFRRDALFEEIRYLGVQTWITGTEVDAVLSLLDHAQHFHNDHGVWSQQ